MKTLLFLVRVSAQKRHFGRQGAGESHLENEKSGGASVSARGGLRYAGRLCLWGFYRRIKVRPGPAQATVATAHFIARVVYRMLKDKVEYQPLSVGEYEKRYQEQQIKYLQKKAAKFGFQLAPL